MLKNKKTVYFCQECGYESAKWMGQCPGCKSWNTFVEETVSTKKPSSSGAMKSSEKRQEPVILKDISLSEDERQTTQIGELDRVLGGGIVPGSLVLVGGDPGIGKSTLLLQVCRNLAEKQVSVLYISGEESLRQIKLRANRIGQFTDKMQLLCETNLEVIREVIERRKPDVVVIDSIQTMFHEDVSSAPGSVSQVRESTNILMQIAKGMGVSIFIVGHVTKDGSVAQGSGNSRNLWCLAQPRCTFPASSGGYAAASGQRMMRTTGTPGSGIPSGCSGRQLFNLQARNLKKWPIPSKLASAPARWLCATCTSRLSAASSAPPSRPCASSSSPATRPPLRKPSRRLNP